MPELFLINAMTGPASGEVPRPSYTRAYQLRPDRLVNIAPFILMVILCIAPLSAKVIAEEDYASGRVAYQQGDFVEAERIWLQLAEQGEVQSQFFLGVLYDQGPEPVRKDDAKASHWFEKAASQGHVNAQFNLGNAYMNGRGVPQDYDRAVHWWRQAADNGSPNAQFNLAIQYYQGRGVEKDWDKAALYFNRAASNGHAKARELIASNQVPLVEETDLPAPSDEKPSHAGSEPARQTQQADSSPIPASASATATATVPVTANPSAVATPYADADISATAASVATGSEPAESGLAWLRDQSPGHFTVQLAASSSLEGVARLVARHQLENNTVRVPVRRDGKLLYYLLMGSFAERQQANLHIESLPADLRASKPWARPFAEIQSLAGDTR